jgi:MFS family permease
LDNSALHPPDVAAEQPGKKVGMFDALRLRDFRWFWIGTLATFLGIQMQWPAQSWLAYELTHSPFKLGMVTAAFGLPMLVISPFAGVLIDRLQKRDVLITSQIANGVIMLVTAILITTHLIQFWHLLVLSVLGGTTASFTMPVRQVIIPEIVPKDMMFNGVALFSGAQNMTRVAAPAMAGALIGVVGVGGAYYCALGFYIFSIASLSMLPRTSKLSSHEGKSHMTELAEGLKYIGGNYIVLTLIIMGFLIALLGTPYQQLMPVFAELLKVGAMGYGLLMAMTGIGAVLGSLGVASLGNFGKKGRLQLGAGIVFGILLVIFAYSPYFSNVLHQSSHTFYLASFILILVGIASAAYMATNTTLIMMHVREELRGRAMSIYAIVNGMSPVGTLIVGAVAEAKGVSFTVSVCGAILALFMVGMAFSSRIRDVE